MFVVDVCCCCCCNCDVLFFSIYCILLILSLFAAAAAVDVDDANVYLTISPSFSPRCSCLTNKHILNRFWLVLIFHYCYC